MTSKSKKIKLHFLNNLTKTLSFNIDAINYAVSPAQELDYIRYIDEAYSATILVSEEAMAAEHVSNSESPGPLPEAIVAHIDKSPRRIPIRRATR